MLPRKSGIIMGQSSTDSAIVYAMYSDREDIDNLMQWRELLYSVKTLREYNTEINVKVYVSPANRVNNISMFPIMENLEIIPIDNPVTHAMPNEQVAKWLDMKYNAAFDTLSNGSYDRVLMIDSDTIYQSDPLILLNKYDENIFYACPDGYDDLFRILGVSHKFMNDGVVIVPRWALEIKDELLEARRSYVESLMNRFENKINKSSDMWVFGICWASFQYGIYEYLEGIQRAVKYFDHSDVATLVDWWDLEDKLSPAIVHYWSMGYKDFLPSDYLVGIEDIMHKSISSS